MTMPVQFRATILTALGLAFVATPAPLAAQAENPAAPTAEQHPDYSALARESIEGAYAAFAEHHPGMYNPLDPDFGGAGRW